MHEQKLFIILYKYICIFSFFLFFFQISPKITIDKGEFLQKRLVSINRSRLFYKDLYFFIISYLSILFWFRCFLLWVETPLIINFENNNFIIFFYKVLKLFNCIFPPSTSLLKEIYWIDLWNKNNWKDFVLTRVAEL